jgi:hypothetical protein
MLGSGSKPNIKFEVCKGLQNIPLHNSGIVSILLEHTRFASDLLINVIASKVVSFGLYTVSSVIMPLLRAFHEVRGLKLKKCVPQFWLNHCDVINSHSL